MFNYPNQKSISFELKGEQKVIITSSTITGCIKPFIPLTPEQESILWDKLRYVDFSNYYINGDINSPKITKSIKKIFLSTFPELKGLINESYPKICHKIADLYTPVLKLKSYWGEKGKLGEGIYEPYTTCFGKDGCNYTSRKFIEGINRVQTLIIEVDENSSPGGKKEDLDLPLSINKPKTSRCLAYFAGNRSIFLTNFYYQGILQDKKIFIEALRRILNSTKVTWAEGSFPLQMIYLNRDCVKVTFPRGMDKERNLKILKLPSKVSCPVCDNITPFKSIRYEVKGNDYLIGCSEDCINSGGRDFCSSCNERPHEDDIRISPYGDLYCESCYSSYYSYCEECQEDVPLDNMIGNYCNQCAISCHHCDSEVIRDKSFEFEGEFYCEDCYSDYVGVCDECGDDTRRDDLKYHEGNDFCKDCYDEKIGICKDCNTATEKNELTIFEGSSLCGDCLMDRKGREEEENELESPSLESPFDKKENSI